MKLASNDPFTEKVEVKLDMLGVSVKDRVRRKVSGSNIITPEDWRT